MIAINKEVENDVLSDSFFSEIELNIKWPVPQLGRRFWLLGSPSVVNVSWASTDKHKSVFFYSFLILTTISWAIKCATVLSTLTIKIIGPQCITILRNMSRNSHMRFLEACTRHIFELKEIQSSFILTLGIVSACLGNRLLIKKCKLFQIVQNKPSAWRKSRQILDDSSERHSFLHFWVKPLNVSKALYNPKTSKATFLLTLKIVYVS